MKDKVGASVDDYAAASWRVVFSTPADGALNMARDESILWAVAAGQAPPTLRFYAWTPACLSLGRGQPVADVEMEPLRAAGFDLVRRPTGGRAILHADEVTYSVVAPETEPRVAGGIVESYRRLSAGLAAGLERLGVLGLEADRRAGAGDGSGPVCFEVPSDYEITVAGRKLAGSAQMRARGVVLQHGAVPLRGDVACICPLLSAGCDAQRVRARAATVEQVLGRAVTWREVAEALAAGFAERLNLRLQAGALSEAERQRAERLRVEKYGAMEWTGRV